MRYEDFELRLAPGPEGNVVFASSSLAGEATGPFELAIDHGALEGLDLGLARAMGVRRHLKAGAATTLSPDELGRAIGESLFRAVFPELVRRRLDDAIGQLRHREDLGLRLRIQVDLDVPAIARLHALPWELLFDPGAEVFLATSRRVSIVRYVNLPLPANRPPVEAPLRVLVAIAAPEDLPALQLSRERTALEKAWKSTGKIDVTFLPNATLKLLRQKLLTGSFHVLHFMGHGDFEPETGEGALCFEDGNGRCLPAGGPELADQLRDIRSLRLVFLNACHTARAAVSGPFAGVATALLRGGVPAVLAMQLPITDQAAIAFSSAVYGRLAEGDSLDAAVAEGRLALAGDSIEWGTPVLFLRARDSQIVRPPAAPPAPVVQVRPARRALRPIAVTAAALAVVAAIQLGPSLLDKKEPSNPPGGGQPEGIRTSQPPPAPGKSYTLIEGVRTPVREINAYITAKFPQSMEDTFANLIVEPFERDESKEIPVTSNREVSIDLPGGRYTLDVKTVDWSRRRVELVPLITQ